MRLVTCAIVLAVAGGSAPARADDEAHGASAQGDDDDLDAGEADPPAIGPTEADPREADGIARPDATPTSTTLLWIPRVTLFVPRLALEVVDAPLRLSMYGYGRYAIGERLGRLFGREGYIKGYPIVHIETGFGVSLGASVSHTNAFGHDERVRVKGGLGGAFRHFYGVKLTSGELFGDVKLTGELAVDVRGNARFYGFGNNDLTDALPAAPVDATQRELAIRTLYAQDTYRFELDAAYAINELVSTKLSTAHITRTFEGTDDPAGPDIADAYDLETLSSFGSGIKQLYCELQLTFDNRRNSQNQLNVAIPNAGWKLSGFGGYALGLGRDDTRFGRFGVDLQRYTWLWNEDRILALRAYGETVTGSLEDIPFMDLPSLGGSRRLRGFSTGRFRDRASGFLAAEYHSPVNLWMSSFLFVEVGRVFESISDVTWRDQRVGFGIGVQIHSRETYLFRAFMASSSDGGLLLHVTIDPIFRQRARTKRK